LPAQVELRFVKCVDRHVRPLGLPCPWLALPLLCLLAIRLRQGCVTRGQGWVRVSWIGAGGGWIGAGLKS
jgi:hypothetical protein